MRKTAKNKINGILRIKKMRKVLGRRKIAH